MKESTLSDEQKITCITNSKILSYDGEPDHIMLKKSNSYEKKMLLITLKHKKKRKKN